MTLRQRLAVRYSTIVVVCLAILGWLTYHEFVEEPALFKKWGIVEPASTELAEIFEVLIFASVPALFFIGWWLVRRSLKPLDDLASSVEHFGVDNLGQRLTRTNNGDEVDRMASAFNTMAGRLEQSVGQIREFTLRASHELKTPLTVMRAQLETSLAQPEASIPSQRAALENLLEETERLARIVDGLTLLSKADAGLVTLQRDRVNLHELVREAAEDAEALAQPARISVRLARCEPAVVLGDRHRLRQVLLNLMDNAAKYNHPGGHIDIALVVEDPWLRLTVTNSGKEIPPEVLPRVFERFVRGSTVNGAGTESCGLGLTIAKWIVEAHRGQIGVISEPGGLTTVSLRLPLATH